FHPILQIEYHSFNQWSREVRALWKALVRDYLQTGRKVMFDGTILQHTIGFLLERDIFEEDIMTYAKQVPIIIAPLEPMLIYLTIGDIERHIRNLYRMRPMSWKNKIDGYIQRTPFGQKRQISGLDGYSLFAQSYKKLCDQLFKYYDFRKLEIDVSYAQWSFYENMVLDFVEPWL
ncbi:hypothetical protein JXQ70_20515, partial [bacterium]|nr:hypothetical protein [bacterium]